MKELEIDIDTIKKPTDALEFFKNYNSSTIKKSQIHIVYDHKPDDLRYFGLLVLFSAAYIFQFEVKKQNRTFEQLVEEYTAEYLKQAFNGDRISKLEQKIEHDLKLNITLKKKELDKSELMEDLFGIWKDKNVNLETIRTKAWPKRK